MFGVVVASRGGDVLDRTVVFAAPRDARQVPPPASNERGLNSTKSSAMRSVR